MLQDSLGDRMKGYETVYKQTFVRRMPLIIRLDGKAFHTYTRALKKKNDDPFNKLLHDVMADTTRYLCENIQNAVFGYTQSDEISILLNDWKEFETQQWYGGELNKIVSVSAAMASAHFSHSAQCSGLANLVGKDFAIFDSRAFNVPKEDTTNYFIWRQKDCIRNSVNTMGQAYISHKDLHGLSVDEVKDKLFLDHEVQWDSIDAWKRYGTCWTKDTSLTSYVPLFTEHRNFIEDYLTSSD